MHRAQHSIVRLGSTPVARRGLSPSACFGRSGSKGAVTSTAQRRASTRRHASAVAGGYGRREEGLAGSTGELVCGVDISVSSTNRWSTTSSFQSQVRATQNIKIQFAPVLTVLYLTVQQYCCCDVLTVPYSYCTARDASAVDDSVRTSAGRVYPTTLYCLY